MGYLTENSIDWWNEELKPIYFNKVDESFIREYADYMNWKNVGLYQLHLSDDFKREMFIK